jgi:hypothetical protein
MVYLQVEKILKRGFLQVVYKVLYGFIKWNCTHELGLVNEYNTQVRFGIEVWI